MALKKIVPENLGYKTRSVSVSKNGCFILCKEVRDEVKHLQRVGVDFYQDSVDGCLWYLHFSADGIIPVRYKSDGVTMEFHSASMRKKILKSINVDDYVLPNTFKISIGKMLIKDQMELFPLLTVSVLKFVKQPTLN